MNHNSSPYPGSLEEIAQQKAVLLRKIRAQKSAMEETARNIFAPQAPAANKMGSIMRAFNTGMAIFDGAMMGWKFIRAFKSFFSKKR